MSPVPEAPSSNVVHSSLAITLATRRFHRRWMQRLNTSLRKSYRPAMRPKTSSDRGTKSAAFEATDGRFCFNCVPTVGRDRRAKGCEFASGASAPSLTCSIELLVLYTVELVRYAKNVLMHCRFATRRYQLKLALTDREGQHRP
jgi:hypothetical protein